MTALKCFIVTLGRQSGIGWCVVFRLSCGLKFR